MGIGDDRSRDRGGGAWQGRRAGSDHALSRRRQKPGDRPGKGGGKRFGTGDRGSEACSVWVGGCPKDITEREIEREFSKHGPVVGSTIKHSPRDTFVFVQYTKESHARDAIEAMNQAKIFGGCVVKVASANRKANNSSKDRERGQFEDAKPFPSRRGRKCSVSPLTRSSPHGRKRSRSAPARRPGGRYNRQSSRSPSTKKFSGASQRDRSPPVKRPSSPAKRFSPPAKRFSPPAKKLSPPAKRVRRCVRVNVENLPLDMQEDELLEIASGFGYVTSYDLRKTGASKTAVLDFRSTDEALKAVEELDDREIEGWDLKVKASCGTSD